jgi:hypothetical protein
MTGHGDSGGTDCELSCFEFYLLLKRLFNAHCLIQTAIPILGIAPFPTLSPLPRPRLRS